MSALAVTRWKLVRPKERADHMAQDRDGNYVLYDDYVAALEAAAELRKGEAGFVLVGYTNQEAIDRLANDTCSATMFGTHSERHDRTLPLYAAAPAPAGADEGDSSGR